MNFRLQNIFETGTHKDSVNFVTSQIEVENEKFFYFWLLPWLFWQEVHMKKDYWDQRCMYISLDAQPEIQIVNGL